MQEQKHGLSVGIHRVENNFILLVKVEGTLTHEDYETITPMLDSALEGVKHPHINVLVDLSEFEGWELRAAWDDLKIGLKYGSDFNKIAVYGNSKKWIEYGIKISSWFLSGEIREFQDKYGALAWLQVD